MSCDASGSCDAGGTSCDQSYPASVPDCSSFSSFEIANTNGNPPFSFKFKANSAWCGHDEDSDQEHGLNLVQSIAIAELPMQKELSALGLWCAPCPRAARRARALTHAPPRHVAARTASRSPATTASGRSKLSNPTSLSTRSWCSPGTGCPDD